MRSWVWLVCALLQALVLAPNLAHADQSCFLEQGQSNLSIDELMGADADFRRLPGPKACPYLVIKPATLRRLLLGPPPRLGYFRLRHVIICDDAVNSFCDASNVWNAACEMNGPFDACDLPDAPRLLHDAVGHDATGKAACFLDLRDLHITFAVDLSYNVFRCNVAIGGAHFEQALILDESRIEGDLDAHGLRVDGNLTMVNVMALGNVEADALRGGGSVSLFGASVYGTLHMRGAVINGHLDLGQLHAFGPLPTVAVWDAPRASVGVPRSGVDISNARIGRQFYLSGTHVESSNVDLSGIAVTGSVWMETGTSIKRTLTLERAHIEDSLLMGDGTFNQVDLTAARVDREVRLENDGHPTHWNGGHFKPADDAIASQDLIDTATWLTLRNARIGTVRDTTEAWPDCLTLAGFSYGDPPHDYTLRPGEKVAAAQTNQVKSYRWCRRQEPADPHDTVIYKTEQPYNYSHDGRLIEPCNFSSIAPVFSCAARREGEDVAPRSSTWWTNWLERDESRTEATYNQLISALSASGQDDITDALSLVKRNFDRHQADGLRWFILSIEGVFVGYGVGLYALFCTLSITVILAFVSGWILYARIAALSSRPPRSPQRSPYWCFAVCFVSTIPILSLPKSVDDFLHTPLGERGPGSVPVSGPTAAMFFLLSAFGWGMSGLLIHGLIRLFDL